MTTTVRDQEHGLMLASEVARLLGCSRQTVCLLFDRGILHGVRTSGGVRLISRDSVDTLMRERRERQEARHE